MIAEDLYPWRSLYDLIEAEAPSELNEWCCVLEQGRVRRSREILDQRIEDRL